MGLDVSKALQHLGKLLPHTLNFH